METKIQMPDSYHCPFCPDHKDDAFYESPLVGQPICEGCSIELDSFCEDKQRPDDFLIDAVEKHTGLPWSECRKVLLEKNLAVWKELEAKQPEWWMESTMKICHWSREQVVAHLHKNVRHFEDLLREIE